MLNHNRGKVEVDALQKFRIFMTPLCLRFGNVVSFDTLFPFDKLRVRATQDALKTTKSWQISVLSSGEAAYRRALR
jgi:hypothetical protein